MLLALGLSEYPGLELVLMCGIGQLGRAVSIGGTVGVGDAVFQVFLIGEDIEPEDSVDLLLSQSLRLIFGLGIIVEKLSARSGSAGIGLSQIPVHGYTVGSDGIHDERDALHVFLHVLFRAEGIRAGQREAVAGHERRPQIRAGADGLVTDERALGVSGIVDPVGIDSVVLEEVLNRLVDVVRSDIAGFGRFRIRDIAVVNGDNDHVLVIILGLELIIHP